MSQAVDDELFVANAEPLRGELTAHCYRMLGSVHEAEDLVQETYLRAWRAYGAFENRSSVRTWMYRIATNACLSALQGRERRPLPTGLGQPASDPYGALDSRPEVPWLEPLPDAMVWTGAPEDPAATTVSRESVRLAFVAALQHLTPPQRAVLILRDVLAWRAGEVAELLELSVAAVNSSLQRAHAQMARLDPDGVGPDRVRDDDRTAELLPQYTAAFEAYDVDRIVALLAEDAVWEMPPFTGWYAGAAAIGALISTACPAQRAGDMVTVPVRSNGQSAFGLYLREPDGRHVAFQLQVPTVHDGRITHVACFFDTGLFARFGLPDTWEAGDTGSGSRSDA
ncbi:MAG: sigG [Friedmanniella sp.]|nr:sigG [Friedmanniella sp.]